MHSHVQTSTTKNMHARDKYHLILKRVNPYEEKRPCAEDSIFPDKWGQESINLKQLYSKFLQGTIITWVDRMKPNRVSKALNSRHMMWIRRWHCPCFPKLWLTSCYRMRSGPLRFFTLGPLCSEFKPCKIWRDEADLSKLIRRQLCLKLKTNRNRNTTGLLSFLT